MTIKEIIERLEKLKELFSDPKRWTINALARDISGVTIGIPTSPDAVCWCIFGGINKTNPITSDYNQIKTIIIHTLRIHEPRGDMTSINDCYQTYRGKMGLEAVRLLIQDTIDRLKNAGV